MRPPELSTKARSLYALYGQLASARIADLTWFSVADWRAHAAEIVDNIGHLFPGDALIVRSSSVREDTRTSSMAGQFESVLNVLGSQALVNAIASVIDSYGSAPSPQDEILVQPMLSDVRLSGVAFTHDPATGSPYRVINYSLGKDTEAVTGGADQTLTFVAAPGATDVPQQIAQVIALLEELELLFPGTPLDVEFALTGESNILYLLQVRPLVLSPQKSGAALQDSLARISKKIGEAQRPHPFLHGRSTVFGVMPDWNPAEIIGVRPRPLALSLYRDLVTDAIWAYQRNNYGYHNLRSFPLLVHFAGQPYIDVRLSFNSFIPKEITGTLADRLVDYYIDRLVAAPALHDKVEFEIVYSCYSLDLPERLKELREAEFSERDCEQLASSLRNLTNRVIDKDTGLWRSDQAKLAVLAQRREEILASGLDPISSIYWLLEDCKRYGTLPFAGLARAGFIAVQMLKSLVAVGVFSSGDYDRFMKGMDTVSGQLGRDLGCLDRSSFLSRYGHLRPGTYDILSPRYDEAPETYLGGTSKGPDAETREKHNPFSLSLAQMRAISTLLREHGLSSDVVGLFDFLQAGIELREYAKFVFTRNLSDALSLFRQLGKQYGFSPDEMSYGNIACIKELYAGTDDPSAVLARSIREGKERYQETCAVWLPPLITRPEDVFAFHLPTCQPNYITQNAVTGHVIKADERSRLEGGIVFIPSADPGFDWLFSHPIAGLVTAYGGVNSHMAIRAHELGLPAIIGAGEALFQRWSQARYLHIDCAGQRVNILS